MNDPISVYIYLNNMVLHINSNLQVERWSIKESKKKGPRIFLTYYPIQKVKQENVIGGK